MGREGEGPKQLLGNFNGLLQTDGPELFSRSELPVRCVSSTRDPVF